MAEVALELAARHVLFVGQRFDLDARLRAQAHRRAAGAQRGPARRRCAVARASSQAAKARSLSSSVGASAMSDSRLRVIWRSSSRLGDAARGCAARGSSGWLSSSCTDAQRREQREQRDAVARAGERAGPAAGCRSARVFSPCTPFCSMQSARAAELHAEHHRFVRRHASGSGPAALSSAAVERADIGAQRAAHGQAVGDGAGIDRSVHCEVPGDPRASRLFGPLRRQTPWVLASHRRFWRCGDRRAGQTIRTPSGAWRCRCMRRPERRLTLAQRSKTARAAMATMPHRSSLRGCRPHQPR